MRVNSTRERARGWKNGFLTKGQEELLRNVATGSRFEARNCIPAQNLESMKLVTLEKHAYSMKVTITEKGLEWLEERESRDQTS
jgi:hypothetical protein